MTEPVLPDLAKKFATLFEMLETQQFAQLLVGVYILIEKVIIE